jgi:hypothetical protein
MQLLVPVSMNRHATARSSLVHLMQGSHLEERHRQEPSGNHYRVMIGGKQSSSKAFNRAGNSIRQVGLWPTAYQGTRYRAARSICPFHPVGDSDGIGENISRTPRLRLRMTASQFCFPSQPLNQLYVPSQVPSHLHLITTS